MTRTLGAVPPGEREAIVAAIHREADDAGWHGLSNAQKGELYDRWAERYDLSRPTIKDSVMKGFDVAQGVAPSGEAAVHSDLAAALDASPVPYWAAKVSLWGGAAQADFVLGFSRRFLTHTVELEHAPTWRDGLMQALWYKSAYLHESGVQAIPTLVLFGDVSAERCRQVVDTCRDHRVLVLAHGLTVRGGPPLTELRSLLTGDRSAPGGDGVLFP